MSDHSFSTLAVRGTNIRLMREGRGSPLLFLNGAEGIARWQPFMQALADRHDVIVPEHPGFGESDTPDWLDTIHDLAYFYLDLIETLDIHAIHLAGHGLGGWIAAEIAVRSTARLASLTLVDAAGIYLPGEPVPDSFLRSDEQQIRDMFFDPAQAEEMIARVLVPENEDVLLKNSLSTARVVWQPRNYDPHLHKWLHRIDVPCLVLWGGEDRLFPPAYAEAYARMIPGARAEIIPDCGHLPQIERPGDFVAALGAFIEKGAPT